MSTTREALLRRLSDHGPLGALTAGADWAATPLGSAAGWSDHLSSSLLLMLGSPHPMWIAWGDGMTTFYNEACVPALGPNRHPGALGRPSSEVWRHVWDQCGAAAERTWREGRATPADVRLFVERGADLEEVFYAFAYSPIRDETGAVAGLLCTMTETTESRLGARRLEVLAQLGAVTADAEGRIWQDAAAILARHADDLPFALLYRIDGSRTHAQLERVVGWDGADDVSCPTRVPLTAGGDSRHPWPIAPVAQTGVRAVAGPTDLPGLPAGPSGLTPRSALVLPLRARGSARVGGILVAGLSPVRPLDAPYQAFCDLVADRLAAGLAGDTSAPPASAPAQGDSDAGRMAREAHEHAERLDGILRQATVGFAQFDLTGRFVLVNQRYCEIVGRSRDALLGLRIQDVTHPDDLPAAAGPLRRAVTSGDEFVIEKRYVRPDGSAVWVRNSVYALRSPTGRPEHLVAISVDVTDQRAAQERLRKSEERYRHIFDHVGASLWEEDMSAVTAAIDAVRATGVTDFRRYFAEHPEFVAQCVQLVRIVNVNAASLRMFGAADKAQLLGSLHNIFEERSRAVFAEGLLAMAEGHSTFEAEAPHRTLRGEPLDVLVSIAMPPPGSASSHALITLTDITARKHAEDALKRSEAHFRIMADTAPAMLWITNDRAEVRFLNLGWYEFTGQPAGAGTGADWTGVVHPDDRLIASATYAAAHRDRKAFRVEYRLRRTDGQYRWVIDAARPRFDADGTFVGHIGAVIDIHERREAEQALHEAYRSLEHTSRVKDEFLATLSHELRTPLNAVLGWARMLRMGTMRPDVQERALESIERNAKAQLHLVEDLLDVSRIISGKLQLKSEVADLAQVIAGAMDATRPTAMAKGLVMEVEADPGMQVLVTGDSDRLQQVVWNLLSNATRFTPAGGHVRIGLSVADAHARIVVADTGQGISPAFLPHVFERFRQEDGTLARRHTGLGLGLAIARHLVEAHGGTISAESPGEGLGATFRVDIPIRDVRPLPPAAPPAGRAEVRTALRGIRILVVDDDPDAREIVRAMAEVYGADAVLAGSAGEALHVLQQDAADVLVADIGMPAQDGYTLMRAIRALPRERGGQIPAIAVTAHAGVHDRDRALQAGFHRHLAKPVDIDVLASAIADVRPTTS